MSDKTAIITGASRGLGRALAHRLAGDGWRLIISARQREPLAEAAVELGAGAIAIAGDVADPGHRAALADAAGERLDLLVNNASVLPTVPLAPLAFQPLADLEYAFRVNAVAPLGLIQATLPALRARRGAVLNITSDAAVEAYPSWGGYGSTKAALEQLSNVLAAEEDGVAVWWFDPGEMRTRMLRAAMPDEDLSAYPPPETVAALLQGMVAERPASGRYQAAALSPRV